MLQSFPLPRVQLSQDWGLQIISLLIFHIIQYLRLVVKMPRWNSNLLKKCWSVERTVAVAGMTPVQWPKLLGDSLSPRITSLAKTCLGVGSQQCGRSQRKKFLFIVHVDATVSLRELNIRWITGIVDNLNDHRDITGTNATSFSLFYCHHGVPRPLELGEFSLANDPGRQLFKDRFQVHGFSFLDDYLDK